LHPIEILLTEAGEDSCNCASSCLCVVQAKDHDSHRPVHRFWSTL